MHKYVTEVTLGFTASEQTVGEKEISYLHEKTDFSTRL